MWLKFSSGFFERNDVRDFFFLVSCALNFVLFFFVFFLITLNFLIFLFFIFFLGGGGGSYYYFLEAEVAWSSG